MIILKTPNNQKGLASIIITSIVVSILTILAAGFAIIMDKELQNTTNRELATQAVYAAESGLNDAKSFAQSRLAVGVDPSTNGKCIDVNANSPPFVKNGSISGDYNNSQNNNTDKYTCVMINARPPELAYKVNAGDSLTFKMVPYASQDGQSNALSTISSIYFSWENQNYNSSGTPLPLPGADTNHRLPKEPEFNNQGECGVGLNCTGMLEVTIYPVLSSDNNVDANQDAKIAQSARTYFLYSNGGDGSVGTKTYSANGAFIEGNCNSSNHPSLPYIGSSSGYCNSAVTGLPVGVVFYTVRIRALYAPQKVFIQAADSSKKPANLGKAQVVLDATGEGNNILKRISERVTLDNNFLPQYGIQSMDTLCKSFAIPYGGEAATLQDLAANSDSACLPQ